jgi:uncharacterized protein (DUF488 family)
MEIYSAGFTKHSARQFFGTLKDQGIERLVDVRLNNTSQLASFAKRTDLEYFLDVIVGAEYIHEPLLAPTQDLLDDYKKNNGHWETYEQRFIELMAERKVEDVLSKDLFGPRTLLLCSENTADHCHRRLVIEYLDTQWGNVRGIHL